jgi:hypothetical protein
MSNELQFINLYCVICHHYDTRLVHDAQRTSNNFLPEFTDEECITIALWGLANRKFTCKHVHKFIKTYYSGWFPKMPKYKAFNKRLAYLADAIKTLANELLAELLGITPECVTHLIDSMPIIVASQSRSGRAKVAPELCNKGYCDSKKMWFYGVRLHVLGQSQHKTLPLPKLMQLAPASHHDRKVGAEMLYDVFGIDAFADKAYINAQWEADMKDDNQLNLLAPVKLQKGQKYLASADSLFSTAVSKVRQPIESFFNWLQELTQIQSASKVRSGNGLISFIFSRIALACLVISHVLDV